MGWNSGYKIMEETVVGTYDLGKLDKDILKILLEPYRNSDIDSGGSQDLRSKDGKTVEEIVIETWGIKLPNKNDNDDDYYEKIYELFSQVTKHFGW